jgi:hypothetical protein
MLERLRTQIGTAGLVVAIVALVAALGGGAYAATGGNSGKATASAKQGKQGKQGKPGKTGPAGPAGPAGTAGPKGDTGAAGSKGDTGSAGQAGAPGTDGVSATGEEFSGVKEGHCAGVGGVKFVAKNNTFACNGKEGSPWTTGGTLPSGKTETGAYGGVATGPGSSEIAPISLTLPVEPAPTPTYVEGDSAAGCPGVVNGIPTADPGNLCLYQAVKTAGTLAGFLKPVGNFQLGASPSGTELLFECPGTSCIWAGSWAVTAE